MLQTLSKSGRLCKALVTCRAAFLFIILIGGFALSIAGYRYVHRMELQAVQEAIDAQVHEQAVLVRTTVLRSLESLHATAALFQTNSDVHRSEFRAFVDDALSRHRELQALGFSPRVTDAQRPAFEAAARADGEPDFALHDLSPNGQFVPSARRPEYFPVRFIEPEDSNRRAIGFSLECSAVRQRSLQKARDTGQLTATPPLRLVQEPADGMGFLVLQPVFRIPPKNASGPPSSDDLIGFASAVFRFDDLLGPALNGMGKLGFKAGVIDTVTNTPVYSAGTFSITPNASSIGLTDGSELIDVAGCRWKLLLQPTDTFIRTHLADQARTIFAAGILLTVLLAGYLYRGMKHLAQVERRVGERTAELSQEIIVRKRAEAAAREAEAAALRAERNYRSIVENSVEGIFQTSLDGQYISANRALARIYGFESPEHLTSSVANIAGQLYVEPGRRDEFIRLIQRDGEVSSFESQIFKRDGTVIWINENARVVRDEQNAVTLYEGTVVDITARKSAEQALLDARDDLERRVDTRTLELACTNAALQVEVAERKRAEEAAAAASRAKSEFLASMSHEIRTPMNAILGYAQLMQRDRSLTRAHADSISTILNSGRHLMQLIDDILDLSKIEAGHTELHLSDFNLHALVHDVADMFRHRCEQKPLKLRLDLPANTKFLVRGDQQKLMQVLINLLGNAVKFTDCGHVTVRVRPVDEDRGDEYRFEVSDSGIGIPADAIPNIFEPFRQAHGEARGGSGLGLAISALHVELMGGELRCESQLGVGSTFSFQLQLPSAQDRSLEEGASALSIMGNIRIAGAQRVRALVVDDVLENRQFLAEVLLAVGCEVETCASGIEAIERAKRRPPQIAFIDLMMPGMDGNQTANQLIAQLGSAAPRLVATTAAVFTHEPRALRADGFGDVLIKPLRIDRVYLSLSTLLGVTFEPVRAAAEVAAATDGDDFAMVELPPAIASRLRESASRYSVTDVRSVIAEIEQLGPEHERTAEKLKDLMRQYDLPAVARFAAHMEPLAEAATVALGAGGPA